MPTLKRSKVVALMEDIGFSNAGVLSTSRLAKKVNRLHRIDDIDDVEVANDNADLLDFILDAIEAGESIELDDDRPDFPKVDREIDTVRKPGGMGMKQRETKYDWDKILDGGIYQLVQGEDYTCKSNTFALQVRATAKRRGIKVKVSVKQGLVVVQKQ